jgi:hypothetical protein
MEITQEVASLLVGATTILTLGGSLLITRQDKAILELRGLVEANRQEDKESFFRLHERINRTRDTMVRKEDIDRIREDIKELKVDINKKLDKIAKPLP